MRPIRTRPGSRSGSRPSIAVPITRSDRVGSRGSSSPGETFHAPATSARCRPSATGCSSSAGTAAVAGNGAGGRARACCRGAASSSARRPARRPLPQPLAANVDVGLVMTSANSDSSPARLDRYVGLLRDGGIEPVLVLSKIDLVDGPGRGARGARGGRGRPRDRRPRASTGAGLDEIRALGGPGRTCVLLGSSGVGKSSLLNALIGTHAGDPRSARDERGRHTTTRRELFVAPDGGLWIDTPGMRELAQWIDDDERGGRVRRHRRARDALQVPRLPPPRRARLRGPRCGRRRARLASFHKLAGERDLAATPPGARRSGSPRRAQGREEARPAGHRLRPSQALGVL